MDVYELHSGRYFGTENDEATHFTSVAFLRHHSDSAVQVCQTVAWFKAQTDYRAQRVWHDRVGEYMCGQLLRLQGHSN
jgi:hypothetical protein